MLWLQAIVYFDKFLKNNINRGRTENAMILENRFSQEIITKREPKRN